MTMDETNNMSLNSLDIDMSDENDGGSRMDGNAGVGVDERIPQNGKRLRFMDEEDLLDDDDDDENDVVPHTIAGPLLVPASEMTIEERSDIWWQPQECAAQKATAKNVAAAIRKREPPCDPNGNPAAYCNVVARVFSACMSTRFQRPSPADVEKLAHWHRVSHSRRGLERWSVPQVAKVRKECRAAVLTAVLDLQYESGELYGTEELAKQIRIASEHMTKAARRFALCLGQADELALFGEAPSKSSSPSSPVLSSRLLKLSPPPLEGFPSNVGMPTQQEFSNGTRNGFSNAHGSANQFATSGQD